MHYFSFGFFAVMARKPQITEDQIASLLRMNGLMSSSDLAHRLGVNRSTITRHLADFQGDLVSVGNTRNTRYTLRRSLQNREATWPIYRIDESGRAKLWATIESLQVREWRVIWPGERPAWISHFADSCDVWEGFPFFLSDIRPQGYLGRARIHRIASILGLPADLRHWGDDEIMVSLTDFGNDLPGDLIVGDRNLEKHLARQMASGARPPISQEEKHEKYPALAESSMDGDPSESSAAGEQPKFCTTMLHDGTSRQVLVKFTGLLNQATTIRWRDLLLCECHASSVLANIGLAPTEVRWMEFGNRAFLEVPRFDRTPEGGRVGMVTLEALYAAAVGQHHGNWAEAVQALHDEGLVSTATLENTILLQCFGELIGNTDMHFGNLSFFLSDTLPLKECPCYDMLPMNWAPGPQGEIRPRAFAPKPPIPRTAAAWLAASDLALEFWQSVVRDPKISADFVTIATECLTVLDTMRTQIRQVFQGIA
jgi:HipA-like C-terminal domain